MSLFDVAALQLRQAAETRQSRSEVSRSKSPDDVTALPELAKPANRYLADRRCRPASMAGYLRRLRRTQELLAEAGFEYGDGATPAADFPWHMLEVRHALAFRSLAEGHFASPKSIDSVFGVVRELVRLAARAGLMTAAERDELIEVLPLHGRADRRSGRELGLADLDALWEAAGAHQRPWFAARAKAILATFMGTGLRVSELIDANVGDLDLGDAFLDIPLTKGGKSRRAYLPDALLPALREWIRYRGTERGPLFPSKSGARLASSSVGYLLGRLEAQAGVRHFSSHDFRRTYVTQMLRAKVDPFTVARSVGHVNVTTTLVYDHRSDLEDRAAVAKLVLPSVQRRSEGRQS